MTHRIASFVLDDSALPPPSPEVEQERNIAIFDLLEANSFRLVEANAPDGPYAMTLALRERILSFEIAAEAGAVNFTLPFSPFRKAARAYFGVCESYLDAVRTRTPDEIARLDEGRKALHNDGAALVAERLAPHAEIDENTSRRLFTLISSLYFKG